MQIKGRAGYSPVQQMMQTSNQRACNQANKSDQQTDSSRNQDIDPELNQDLQEVYVYDCCCVSREMSPAIEHLGTLSSLFVVFNLLVFASGFGCLGMGLWYRIDPKVYEIHKYIETQNFTIAGWIMLFGGFTSCLIALLGFIASTRRSQTFMALYIGVLVLLATTFVGTLVLLVVHGLGSTLEMFLNKEIYEQIRRRTMSNEINWLSQGSASQFLDFLQVKLRCCGAVDFTDYEKLGLVVPTTCYTIEKNYINAPGCGHALRQLFDIRAGMAAGFVSASIVSQLISLIVASLMFCSIYHWRANPRPVTPVLVSPSDDINHNSAVKSTHLPRTSSPISQYQHKHPVQRFSYQYQRPRSRTPIIM